MFLRILIAIFIMGQVHAIDGLERAYLGKDKSTNWYRSFIEQLVSEKRYFTAVYWFKDYIGKGLPFDSELDTSLARVVEAIGVSQFEYLQTRYLDISNSATM